MREASNRRTVTDTDSCAFFVKQQTPTRGRPRHHFKMTNVISTINDIDGLRLDLASFRAGGMKSLFRGQSDENWKIVSSLKRIQDGSQLEAFWSTFKNSFTEVATQLKKMGCLKYKPEIECENFYILSVARHLGFPCNLIDWTSSLDMALFSACKENPDKNGALYILLGNLEINQTPIEIDPLTVDESLVVCKDFDYVPSDCCFSDLPLARRRRFRQNGFFSVISQKDTELDFEQLLPEDISIQKIIITSSIKSKIIDLMQQRGISDDWFLLGDSFKNQSIQIISDIKSKYFNK